MLTRAKIELALIPVAVALVGLASPHLPSRLGTGPLLVIACLTWLVQGGLRDLWLLYLVKRRPAHSPPRRLACMCLESSVGLTGVLVGVVLALCDLGRTFLLTPARWMLLAAIVLTLGFLARDLIISWRPLGLRRDPDHHSIVFTWWS
jgi:hypothetical protein